MLRRHNRPNGTSTWCALPRYTLLSAGLRFTLVIFIAFFSSCPLTRLECVLVCVCYEMIAPLSATRYSSLLMLYVFFFYSIRFFHRSRAVFSSETLDRLHPHLLCLCSIPAVVCLFQCVLFHVYLFPWTSWRDYRLIPYGIFFIEFNRKHVF